MTQQELDEIISHVSAARLKLNQCVNKDAENEQFAFWERLAEVNKQLSSALKILRSTPPTEEPKPSPTERTETR